MVGWSAEVEQMKTMLAGALGMKHGGFPDTCGTQHHVLAASE